MMNFQDAVDNMVLGKRLIRVGWSGMYLTVLPTQNYIWHIGNGTKSAVIAASIYVPSIEDIQATDWFIKNT